MKIHCLKKTPYTYSCNSYLILGDWNALEDVSALIDPGIDGYIGNEISRINTGVGKAKLDFIILTHNHFDHSAGVGEIKARFGGEVLASIPGPQVDRIIKNGEKMILGDQEFEVIHVPAHSEDSICLYCRNEGVLFTGDTPVNIKSPSDKHCAEYLAFFERLNHLPINSIYCGHDPPIDENPKRLIKRGMEILKKDC